MLTMHHTLLVRIIAGLAFVLGRGAAWDYSKPKDWVHNSASCGGSYQSPINIVDGPALGSPQPLARKMTYTPQSTVNVRKDSRMLRLEGNFAHIKLPNGWYKAETIDFHVPSEHTINGTHFFGEMQITFRQTRRHGDANELAILAVLLDKAGPGHHDFLSSLNLDKALNVKHEEEMTFARPVNLESISNIFDGHFYHYQGSQTVPPCSEGVHWFVLQSDLGVRPKLAYVLETLFPFGNNRPVQPLHARPVESNLVYVSRAHEYVFIRGQDSGFQRFFETESDKSTINPDATLASLPSSIGSLTFWSLATITLFVVACRVYSRGNNGRVQAMDRHELLHADEL